MIDILITSASRPEYLKRLFDSLFEYLEGFEEAKVYLHEDIVNEEESKKVLSWISTVPAFVDMILITTPAKKDSHAIKRLLNVSKSKYALYCQDDWILLKPVPTGDIIQAFEDHEQINQIAFNRGKNRHYHNFKEIPTRHFSRLVQCFDWILTPAIWRMSYIKPRFKVTENADDIGLILRGGKTRDEKWLADNMGSYFWGG